MFLLPPHPPPNSVHHSIHDRHGGYVRMRATYTYGPHGTFPHPAPSYPSLHHVMHDRNGRCVTSCARHTYVIARIPHFTSFIPFTMQYRTAVAGMSPCFETMCHQKESQRVSKLWLGLGQLPRDAGATGKEMSNSFRPLLGDWSVRQNNNQGLRRLKRKA